MIGDDFGHRYIGHGGWVNGFVSRFKRYPNDDAVLIILSNIESASYITVSQDLGDPLRTEIHSSCRAQDRTSRAGRAGSLRWQLPVWSDYCEDQHAQRPPLCIWHRPTRAFRHIATSDTEFYFNDTSSEVRFVVDDKGVVNQFMLKMGDKEMPVPRISQPQPGS